MSREQRYGHSSMSSNMSKKNGNDRKPQPYQRAMDQQWTFNGDKDDFNIWQRKVRAEITETDGGGPKAVQFLFNFDDTNPDHAMKDIPERLEIGDLVNGTPATHEMCVRRDHLIRCAEDFNARFDKMEIVCWRACNKYVNESLKTQFTALNCDPIACYHYMINTFGPVSRGAADTGATLLAMIRLKMENEDFFCNFTVVFEDKMREAKMSKNLAVGLLHSDGQGEYGIQMLPDRLIPAVTHCKNENKDYEGTTSYILQVDTNQHKSGIRDDNTSKINRTKKFNDRSNITCLNCNNKGHRSNACQARFCGYCLHVCCNHNSYTCEDRENNLPPTTEDEALARLKPEHRVDSKKSHQIEEYDEDEEKDTQDSDEEETKELKPKKGAAKKTKRPTPRKKINTIRRRTPQIPAWLNYPADDYTEWIDEDD